MYGCQHLAKVRVAGSNPVVRSVVRSILNRRRGNAQIVSASPVGRSLPEDGRAHRDVDDAHVRCGSVTRASRFLIGLVTCFATHNGIPLVARATWRR